jgi:hypothetical protein
LLELNAPARTMRDDVDHLGAQVDHNGYSLILDSNCDSIRERSSAVGGNANHGMT